MRPLPILALLLVAVGLVSTVGCSREPDMWNPKTKEFAIGAVEDYVILDMGDRIVEWRGKATVYPKESK